MRGVPENQRRVYLLRWVESLPDDVDGPAGQVKLLRHLISDMDKLIEQRKEGEQMTKVRKGQRVRVEGYYLPSDSPPGTRGRIFGLSSDSRKYAGREGVVTGVSGETVMVALRGEVKSVPFSVDELRLQKDF